MGAVPQRHRSERVVFLLPAIQKLLGLSSLLAALRQRLPGQEYSLQTPWRRVHSILLVLSIDRLFLLLVQQLLLAAAFLGHRRQLLLQIQHLALQLGDLAVQFLLASIEGILVDLLQVVQHILEIR